MNGKYRSQDAQLNYVETGSGLPIVFLHPTPLDHDYWRPLVHEFDSLPGGPVFRAIMPDFRGHGDSKLGAALPVGAFPRVPDAPVLTTQQLAEDVLTLLDTLHVPEAVFVGCSIGGYVMLELWRQAPYRMRALAFVCSKPQADPEPALIKRAANIGIARQSGVSALFDGMANLLIGENTRQHRPEIAAECRARMTLTPEAFIAVQAGLAARPDSTTAVETIDSPVLATAGGQDTAIDPADMEAFRVPRGAASST